MMPVAFEIAAVAAAVFLAAGMVRDKRRFEKVHPAWWWGLAGIAVLAVLPALVAPTALGDRLYEAVVAGAPGADVPGMAFAPPPGGPLITGR